MAIRISILFSILIISLYEGVLFAETIEIAEEELAKESVLPVFDKAVVVRQRAVTTEGRFELGVGFGLNLVEPLYEQPVYNFLGTYHFTETHAVNIFGMFLSTGLSGAGKDLKAGKGLTNNTFDASLAPTIDSMFFANYQFTAYYGKMNFSKQSTTNLALYGLVGAAMINWSDKPVLGLDAGVGQKIYFNKNFLLRADLFLTLYQGPDPTDPKDDQYMDAGDPELKSADFKSTFYFRPFLTASAAYLF